MTITHERGGVKWNHNDSLLTQLECDYCWRNIEKRLMPRIMPAMKKYMTTQVGTLWLPGPGGGGQDPNW